MNWSAILIDAGLRGIWQAELARELKCSQANVSRACKRYAVRLDPPPDGYRNRVKHGATISAKAAKRWTRRFAECEPSLTLNQFCIRYRTNAYWSSRMAAKHGYKFAPSNASSRRAG